MSTPGTSISAIGAGLAGRPPGWRGLLVNAAVCFGIACILQVTIEGAWFLGNLLISLSIGFSIYGTIWLGFRFLGHRLPSALIVPGGIAFGLCLGLGIGGAILAGDVTWFFRDDDASPLILGVIFGVAATAAFRLLGNLLDVRARLEEAERIALERDKAMAEAELRVLQAQIEPHFLFNTLANVGALVRSDPDRAEALLERLTSLLRTSLARTRSGSSTISAELSVVRDYLEIQTLRMGGRLHYEIEIGAALDDVEIPPLLVQPLVENAVLHGIEPRSAPGSVRIEVSRVAGRIDITVDDDGVGLDAGSAPAGTGLANVRERLRAIHGNEASLELLERAGGGVRAQLSLPVEAE